MHLIIDIRTENRNPFPLVRYAESWANYWVQTHPGDTCSFLVLKGQIAPKKFPYIIGKKSPSLLSQTKAVFQKKSNTKCVSFSDFAPYYPHLETISHIFDMSDWLYTSGWKKEIIEQRIKKKITNSTHIIVPNFFTGNEITEFTPQAEDKIEIIPYFPIGFIPPETALFSRMRIPSPYFLYDGAYK